MTEHLDRAHYLALKQAIDTLAGVCDGAVSRDQEGYNGSDAPLGHLLAFLPLDAWPPAALYRAWSMLRKYRLQLARAGIVYADLPEPSPQEQDRIIGCNDAGEFLVIFPYADHVITALKEVPGYQLRRKPVPHRVVRPLPGMGDALLTFAERSHFTFAPGVRALVELFAAESVITVEEDCFGIYFPKDLRKNDAIKAIAGWRVSREPCFHWLIPITASEALSTFLARYPHTFALHPDVTPSLLASTSGGRLFHHHVRLSLPLESEDR